MSLLVHVESLTTSYEDFQRDIEPATAQTGEEVPKSAEVCRKGDHEGEVEGDVHVVNQTSWLRWCPRWLTFGFLRKTHSRLDKGKRAFSGGWRCLWKLFQWCRRAPGGSRLCRSVHNLLNLYYPLELLVSDCWTRSHWEFINSDKQMKNLIQGFNLFDFGCHFNCGSGWWE